LVREHYSRIYNHHSTFYDYRSKPMWLLDFHSICHDVCTPWALSLHISYTIATADNRKTDLAGQSPPSQPDAIQDHLDLAYLIVRRASKRPVKPIGVTNRCIHLLREQLLEKSYLFMWAVPRGAFCKTRIFPRIQIVQMAQ